MKRLIVFDMDGTIADFYGVNGWLEMLENEDDTPYEICKPLVNMETIGQILQELQELGNEVRIITWASRNASEDFKNNIALEKWNWLMRYNFPFDNFHCVAYGTNKNTYARRYFKNFDEGIIFDDDIRVRNSWNIGRAINPNEVSIENFLKELLAEGLTNP